MRRADLLSCLILVLGIIGMVAAARSGEPLRITPDDCVDLWNATPIEAVTLAVDSELRIFAEGEQDLGYGLCSVTWSTSEAECLSLQTPVWKDTSTWDRGWNRTPHRCQPSLGGTLVVLAPDGRLRLQT